MSKSYTVGYMPKPSYSGTKYEELKDVLKESGIISENTPDNAIPTVVEESLVDLKPENVRGNVKIGNVVGTVIETLEDVNVENIEDYSIYEINNSPFDKILYTDGNYLYGSKTGEGRLCYNKLTGVVTPSNFELFNQNDYYLQFYKNPTTGYTYLGGEVNNLYYTAYVSYVYKDIDSGKIPIPINNTNAGVIHINEYTYIFGNGSNTGMINPHIIRLNKDQYVELTPLGSYSTFYKVLGVIGETVYFACYDISNSTNTGFYKLNGLDYEKIYSGGFSYMNNIYGKVINDTIIVLGSDVKGIFKIKNDEVTQVYSDKVSFPSSFFVRRTPNNVLFITWSETSTSNGIYILPKDSNEIVYYTPSNTNGINFLVENGDKVYFNLQYGADVLVLYNNEVTTYYTSTSTSVNYFVSSKNDIYFTTRPNLIKIKNGNIFEFDTVGTSWVFEDADGQIYAGDAKIYKLNDDNSFELVYTHYASLMIVGISQNGTRYFVSRASTGTAHDRVVALKEGKFTSLLNTKEGVCGNGSVSLGIGVPCIVGDALILEMAQYSSTSYIRMVKELNDRFVVYSIKTIK